MSIVSQIVQLLQQSPRRLGFVNKVESIDKVAKGEM
jgi:hypothetical protein